jgi:hypothetical protein
VAHTGVASRWARPAPCAVPPKMPSGPHDDPPTYKILPKIDRGDGQTGLLERGSI